MSRVMHMMRTARIFSGLVILMLLSASVPREDKSTLLGGSHWFETAKGQAVCYWGAVKSKTMVVMKGLDDAKKDIIRYAPFLIGRSVVQAVPINTLRRNVFYAFIQINAP